MNLDPLYAIAGIFTLLFLFYLCIPDQPQMSEDEFKEKLRNNSAGTGVPGTPSENKYYLGHVSTIARREPK